MRAKEFIVEADSYSPPTLNVGDRILKGKFKNSPAEIKGFTKDKHNQPVLKTNRGEVQLFKPRVTKLMDKDVAEGSEEITEYRDRMYQYIKSIVPGFPDYVVKDWLYANFARGATQGPNWSFHTIGQDIPKILADMGLSVDTKWQLVPNMKFTMSMWEPKTLKRLQARAGGSSKSADPDVHIPANDAERHATQDALAKQQGGVRKEPVILIKTPQGYELLEGWHRTIQHFHKFPDGYTGPAYVAVAQGQQGVAEGLNEPTSQLGPQLFTPHPKNLDESMKPENVLWTSTASGDNNGYTSAWVRWAKNEMPQWIGHSGFLYDVSPNARILTINSDQDAMRVANKYGMNTTDIMDLFMWMPWKKIAKDYDAIHHVPSNRGADIFMHSWDVESTAWFNTKMLLNKRKVPILASKQGNLAPKKLR